MQNNFLFVLFCFSFLFFYLKKFFFVAKRDNFGVGGKEKGKVNQLDVGNKKDQHNYKTRTCV